MDELLRSLAEKICYVKKEDGQKYKPNRGDDNFCLCIKKLYKV